MSLRAKLLLLSLMTLVLPWAGWQYAQQMETTLRSGQEAALLTTAQVLGRVVASEPELLYRVPELRRQFDPARGDLFAPLLPAPPLIDGFADEWPALPGGIAGSGHETLDANRRPPMLRLGVHGRWMHMYAQVSTTRLRYADPQADDATTGSRHDRLIVLTRDEFGHERAWSLSAVAPGALIIRHCEIGAPWKELPDEVRNVSGVWRETPDGYAVELRGPLNIFGTRISMLALDQTNATLAETRSLAWVHTGSDALKQRLEQYAPAGVRVSVVDEHGWLLARAGSVATAAGAGSGHHPGLRHDENDFTRSIYRVLFSAGATPASAYAIPYGMWGAPVDSARQGQERAIWFDKGGGEPSLVRAAVPIRHRDQTLGALVVEQPGEQLLLVREMALTRLLNLTLVATLFVIIVTLAFGARLSHRIRRLSRAASTALTAEGLIEADIPDTQARDEIGALARSYDTLLGRVKEYTHYLQTLGTKLSHELRTPLTIVSSSLDNLSSEEQLPTQAHSYLARARGGASRMHAILTAMSEATRVEQSIEHTERTRFDLSELVHHMGQAYQQTFASHRFEIETPDQRCMVDGSPDLIAQLLDKLMDNARDFALPGTPIAIVLERDSRHCWLSVRNQGPSLPPHLDDRRLFESLVSGRGSTEGRPHLGLGLYIVRLIADFHHGTMTASDLPDGDGVVMTLQLPLSW